MADEAVKVWPRPYFKATEQQTKIFFVCFAKGPLRELPLSRSRYGLPTSACVDAIDVRLHQRSETKAWFEGWFSGAFGVVAARDLGDELPLLTDSDHCISLGLELPDQPDLAPQQSMWALCRWLCERGAAVVLDVHAFVFRTRQDLEQLSFDGVDAARDVKLVLENEPTRDGLHLLHTRGLCKFARPELLCFVQPDDAALLARAQQQIARAFIEGVSAPHARLQVSEGVELVTRPLDEPSLLRSLGLEAAVELARADGSPLRGIGALVPAP